jgi:hypothetical protein
MSNCVTQNSIEGSILTTGQDSSYGYLIPFIVIFIFIAIQVIAIPSTNVPAIFILLLLTICTLYFKKIAINDKRNLLIYLFMISVSAISTTLAHIQAIYSSQSYVSLQSYFYLIILSSVFCVRLKDSVQHYLSKKVLRSFLDVMLLFGVLGIVQFIIFSPENFSLLRMLPEGVGVTGYSDTYRVIYVLPYLKSNGFVFYEPSFFSQFQGLALVIEFACFRRWWRLFIHLLALILSFSGTGLIVVAVAGLAAFLRPSRITKRRVFAFIVPVMLVVISVVGLANTGLLDVYTKRFTEFTERGSSGNMRFVAPYDYLIKEWSDSNLTLLFGLGPGTSSVIEQENGDVTFNALTKMGVEYGILGLAAVIAIYWRYLRKVPNPIWYMCALAVFQLFLSGGLLQPLTVGTFWLLSNISIADGTRRCQI